MLPLNNRILSNGWEGDFSIVGTPLARVSTLWQVERFYKGRRHRMFVKAYSPDKWHAASLSPLYDVLVTLPERPDVRISVPIRTVDGSWSFEATLAEEPVHLCLMNYAEGRDLTFSSQDFQAYGTALARLHKILENNRALLRSISIERLVDATYQSLIQAGPAAACLAPHVLATRSALIRDLDLKKLTCGICHGDANMSNAKINEGLVSFIDFDDYVIGPHVLDIARSAQWIRGITQAQEIWDSFMFGYGKIKRLNADDFSALPSFILLGVFQSLRFLAQLPSISEQIWMDQRRTLESWILFWEKSKGKVTRRMVLTQSDGAK